MKLIMFVTPTSNNRNTTCLLTDCKKEGYVGSRTRDCAKAEPGLVKKIADLTILNQSRGKSESYAHAARVGMQNHSKANLFFTSLL
jgi:hypothetical protein